MARRLALRGLFFLGFATVVFLFTRPQHHNFKATFHVSGREIEDSVMTLGVRGTDFAFTEDFDDHRRRGVCVDGTLYIESVWSNGNTFATRTVEPEVVALVRFWNPNPILSNRQDASTESATMGGQAVVHSKATFNYGMVKEQWVLEGDGIRLGARSYSPQENESEAKPNFFFECTSFELGKPDEAMFEVSEKMRNADVDDDVTLIPMGFQHR